MAFAQARVTDEPVKHQTVILDFNAGMNKGYFAKLKLTFFQTVCLHENLPRCDQCSRVTLKAACFR